MTLRCIIAVLFLKRSVRYLADMTKPRVYVETTIPSFYHEDRTDPGIVAHRVNAMLGLFVPALVPPMELLEGSDEKNLPDPVIAEIREVRHHISARFEHDPA